jgi:hypothetical protein
MSSWPLALLGLAFTLSATPSAQAGADKVWSALVVANNSANPKEAPDELKPILGRLKRVFGYNQFEIVGSDSEEISDGVERQLKPSKTFWMNLRARRASIKEARGGYLLNVQLYQEKRPLVDTVALVAPGSPLFFRGPMHARGQLLMVIQINP